MVEAPHRSLPTPAITVTLASPVWPWQLNVRTLTGSVITLEVQSSDTIINGKQKINDQIAVPAEVMLSASEVAPDAMDSPDGWGPSWAQWPNGGTGGFTRDRHVPSLG